MGSDTSHSKFTRFLLRAPEARDAQAVCEVWVRSIRESCSLDHRDDESTIQKWTFNKTPENLAAWFKDPHEYWVVACKGQGEIIGLGCLTASGEIRACYVHPRAKGRSAGRTILRNLEKRAIGLGLEVIRLQSTGTALGFYQKNGYERDGELVRHFGVVKAYPMKKRLVRQPRGCA